MLEARALNLNLLKENMLQVEDTWNQVESFIDAVVKMKEVDLAQPQLMDHYDVTPHGNDNRPNLDNVSNSSKLVFLGGRGFF